MGEAIRVSDHEASPAAMTPKGEPAAPAGETAQSFMNVRQLAGYLQINEKKIYALANEGRLPGTKITGKWLFPKSLIDNWLIESSHGGVLSDRLVIAGSEDPLLCRLIADLTREYESRALISHSATGIPTGLDLLACRRVDACCLHWGPVEDSLKRHASLICRQPESARWLIVRLCQREQGFMLAPSLGAQALGIPELYNQRWRWAMPPEGSGSRHFLEDLSDFHALDTQRLNITAILQTERELASLITRNQADIAPGPRSIASEFGLRFISAGWEGFDMVLTSAVYFRYLFQAVLEGLKRAPIQALAHQLGGYRFQHLGRIIWAP
jgi:excisionase family DNA binding protein